MKCDQPHPDFSKWLWWSETSLDLRRTCNLLIRSQVRYPITPVDLHLVDTEHTLAMYKQQIDQLTVQFYMKVVISRNSSFVKSAYAIMSSKRAVES